MKSRFFQIISVLGISMLLASCVGTQMSNGLEALRGEDIHVAYQVLGYPDARMDLGGEVVYKWSSHHMGVISVPQTAQASTYVNGSYVTATATYDTYEPVTYYAVIKIAANRQGTILNYSWTGNNGGLLAYSSRLAKFASQKPKSDRPVSQEPRKSTSETSPARSSTPQTRSSDGTLYLKE